MTETKVRLEPQPLYIVSDERRFVYFVVQKVACSSIKTALLPFFDVDTAPYETTLNDGTQTVRIHQLFYDSRHQIPRRRFVQRLDEGEYRDYFKFAFVRNPWDRLVSLYFQKLSGRKNYAGPDLNPPGVEGRFYTDMPFAEYIEAVCRTPDEEANPHFRSQHLVICRRGKNRTPMADFVGHFENLPQDFARVAARIGAPDLQLPHRLRSKARKKQHYSEFYDARLRDLVAERFHEDIEIFGYSF